MTARPGRGSSGDVAAASDGGWRSTLVVGAVTVLAVVAAPAVGVTPVVAALVLAALLANLPGDPLPLAPAVGDLLLKRVLRGAIVALGATVDASSVSMLGPRAAAAVVVAVVTALAVAALLGTWLRAGRDLTLLVGVGCAICGASAIAAVAPVIGAARERVGVALATVFSLNAAALLLLGPIGAGLGLDAVAMGTWAGVAVHDTASAVALGFAVGPESGEVATVVKLARTLALVPLVAVVAVAVSRRAATPGTAAGPTPGAAPGTAPGRGGPAVAVRRAVPPFVVAFVLVAVVASLGWLPAGLVDVAGTAARTAIVAVVAGIGLTLRWSRVAAVGGRSAVVGAGTSVAVAVATLLVVW